MPVFKQTSGFRWRSGAVLHTCNSQPSGGGGRKAVSHVLELSSPTTVPSHSLSLLPWGPAENAHCGKNWQGSKFITGYTFLSAPPMKSGASVLSAVHLQAVLLLLRLLLPGSSLFHLSNLELQLLPCRLSHSVSDWYLSETQCGPLRASFCLLSL